MAIKLSDVKRVAWKQTFILNFLLYFYPTIIFFFIVYLREFKQSLNVMSFTFQIITLSLITPLFLSVVIGPIYSLLIEVIRVIKIPIIQNLANLALFPVGLFCCIMIFIGTLINFLLIWSGFERLRLEEDPHLFRWNSYITLLKPTR